MATCRLSLRCLRESVFVPSPSTSPTYIGSIDCAQRVWLSGGDHPWSSPKEIGPDMVSGPVLVEAAGQLVYIFQYRLDYSFTCRCRQGRAYCGLAPTLVLHGDNSLGAYESLAGFSVSRSPDGVGVGRLPLSVHRMSSLFQRGSLPVATIVLIEPASASTLPSALHAYPRLLI